MKGTPSDAAEVVQRMRKIAENLNRLARGGPIEKVMLRGEWRP